MSQTNYIIAAFLFGIALTWFLIYLYGLQITQHWRKNLKEGDRVIVSNSKTEAWEGEVYYISHTMQTSIIRGEKGLRQVKIKHLWKPSSL